MATPQEIIEKLKAKGMNYASIGAAIGASRESVSRIAHGQQSGERMLPALRKLYELQKGKNYGLPYTSSITYPKEPDVPPLTEEELRHEEEWDKYAQWEELQPVAHKVGEVIKGTRGKIVEKLLPEGYSVVRASPHWNEYTRVVESTPPPKKPRGGAPHPHRPRERKSRQQHVSAVSLDRYIERALARAWANHLAAQQSQLPAVPPQHIIPRYVPTYQYRETQEYVTLATPRTPYTNTLGYTPQTTEREPVRPQIHFGKIPTDRYNP